VPRRLKKFAGEWKKLVAFRRFQTLASFPYLLRPIRGDLRGMGMGAYCLVRRDRDWTRKDSRRLERVMMIFWAANDEWAEAVAEFRRYDQVSDATVDFEAPMELLPKGARDWTNAETYRAARSDRRNAIPESG